MIDKTMIIKGIVTLSMRKNYYCLNIKKLTKSCCKNIYLYQGFSCVEFLP